MQINHSEKSIEGLSIWITELDPYRPPIKIGLIPYSMKTATELISKQDSQYYLIENNPNLNKKVIENLDPFFQEVKYPFTSFEISSTQFLIRHIINSSKSRRKTDLFQMKNSNLDYIFKPYIVLMILYVFLIFIIGPFINNILNLTLTLVTFLIIYLIFVFLFTIKRQIAGKKYDSNMKKTIQELIDYGVELNKKEDLNPKNFPIKLRHKDYQGLTYETINTNNYIGYFKK